MQMITITGKQALHGRIRPAAAKNSTLPLLAAGKQVLWICGEGFADGLAPGPDTERLLQVKLENWEESNHDHA